MAAITVHSDFEAQENKAYHCFHFFPTYLPWSDGTGCYDFSFLNVDILSPAFYSFIFMKRLFSSFSLSAIMVVSSAHLMLLIFLPAILIPACTSFSPAFCMMYSSYKLNKQYDNIQLWHTPFLNFEADCCSISGSVSSWLVYTPISLFHLQDIVLGSSCPSEINSRKSHTLLQLFMLSHRDGKYKLEASGSHIVHKRRYPTKSPVTSFDSRILSSFNLILPWIF